MSYEFMRLILLFDLPMITKSEKRIYTKFRKNLIQNGYIMMQFSVYSKIFNNREAADNHTKQLKRFLPTKGQIRIMLVTENQYAKIQIIVGGISKQEEIMGIEPLLRL
jgi:CRISPR-associated protein Cas2